MRTCDACKRLIIVLLLLVIVALLRILRLLSNHDFDRFFAANHGVYLEIDRLHGCLSCVCSLYLDRAPLDQSSMKQCLGAVRCPLLVVNHSLQELELFLLFSIVHIEFLLGVRRALSSLWLNDCAVALKPEEPFLSLCQSDLEQPFEICPNTHQAADISGLLLPSLTLREKRSKSSLLLGSETAFAEATEDQCETLAESGAELLQACEPSKLSLVWGG